MVDVKSFAAEATTHLGKIFNTNIGQVASDIENGFKDPSVDKELYQRRLSSKIMTYEEALKVLTYVNIEDGYKTINDKMYPYFYRLFDVSIQEKAQTLVLLGNDAVTYGDQDSLTPILDTPRYAEGVTYSEFMKNAKLSEKNGQMSTMYDTVTYSPYYNNGQLYKKSVNLYPDDNDTGLHGESDYEFNKWDVDGDPNSILFKTKQLFRQRKINTLISRFGTHADEGGGTLQYNGENSDPYYGESRGRNLLTKAAEKGISTYKVNGYNNPYCRVWTHHYQHAKMADTMRPFLDESGLAVKNSDFHKWDQFKINDNSAKKVWGWKNGDANWDKSVLDKDTGLLNMTPIFKDPGKGANIHTKDCMFSIENLAWKDFDPYSFERALSWEQRGPLGGRIMWFPPYGIKFNENVTTDWTENRFIGRGESVYSYVNTRRGGTLEFMMVVDHPSVVDYALWDEDNPNEVTDTDLLRFFAGCDYETVTNAAKPTPLTDEYFKFGDGEGLVSEMEKTTRKKQKTIQVKSSLYFPNNYTGLWDIKYFNSNPLGYLFSGCGAGETYTKGTKTLNIKKYDFNDIEKGFWEPYYENFCAGNDTGVGYETGSGPLKNNKCKDMFVYYDSVTYLSNEGNNYEPGLEVSYRIDGAPIRPKQTNKTLNYSFIGESSSTVEIETSTNVVDDITIEELDSDRKIKNNYATNTYGQLLWEKNEREDNTDNGLNFNHTKFDDTTLSSLCFFGLIGLLSDTENADKQIGNTTRKKMVKSFSLSDDAEQKYSSKDNGENLTCTDGQKKLFETILSLFTEKKDKIEKLSFVINGAASGDGKSNPNSQKQENRNIYLANARAISTKKIIENFLSSDDKIQKKADYVCDKSYTGQNPEGVNSLDSKKDRKAEILLTITYNEDEEFYAGNGKEMSVSEYNDYIKGYEPTNNYVDKSGKRIPNPTISEENSSYYRRIYKNNNVEMVEYGFGKWMTLDNYVKLCQMKFDKKYNKDGEGIYTIALGSHDSSGAVNKIRYDQEYYFFKKLKQEDPIVFQRLVDKLRYFDPAFHTMTPEGFNARLTFLHQCTRQGDTTTASDKSPTSANNLAFGRPPFCVLRLGDFYNQMIVIKSVNIDYSVSEGITWDLNQEGAGVQPLLCRVTLSFDFIGGGDLAGPVRRLQNAMSFNYYANTGLYDNRADRPKYNWDSVTGKSEFVPNESYAHSVTKDYEDIYPTYVSVDEYVSGVNDYSPTQYTEQKKWEDMSKEEKQAIRKKRMEKNRQEFRDNFKNVISDLYK